MINFDISTDSTADLYSNEIKENNLYFLPLTFTLTDKSGKITEHTDTFNSPEEYVEYYNTLRSGIMSKTSMNNPQIHIDHFTAMAKAGVKNAIHFTISYGLCRTVEVARDAVEEVKKEYPDFNCLCVECNTTTIGQGLLVKMAVKMRDEGKSLQETFDYVEKTKKNFQHFIIADDLMYLKRGGRLSAASAFVGTIINIKPVIIFNKEGKLVTYKKERGLKRAISSIVEDFSKYTLNKDFPTVYVGHTDNMEMANLLAKSLEDRYGVKTEIRMIGPIIGSHLGPNTVAYAFSSNEERPM
ncbi:MAG: DegV family protein [Clostridia bacterium]|nr:DegV family protein [Clostridia bacterium]